MIIAALIAFISILYISIILFFSIGLQKLLSKRDNGINKFEKLSVVIPFRNEANNLPLLLESLTNQSLPKELFEIILVNDHSTDNSWVIAQEISCKFQNIRVVALADELNGKKAALSFGVGLAINPVIAFTDADCLPSNYWLESISRLVGNGVDFIVGTVVLTAKDDFVSKIQSLEYASLMATAAGSCGIEHPVIASSANLAFNKEVFDNLHEQFNPMISSGDDMFLLHRAKRIKNCKISFLIDTNAFVETSTQTSISGAINQRKRWASKSIFYRDIDTILIGLIVLLFNLLLIALLIGAIFAIHYLLIYAILLVIKSSVDYLLVSKYLKFVNQEKLLRIFLPLQLLYPLYVVYSFFVGIVNKGYWKGRKIS
ncbi:MAG TPA: hypothetical protein DIW31_09005 [Bacteroidales bacterium]|nr:hypothetical protein [Bacteroidales bacterium]